MTKLPIATTFCGATIPLWDGLEFFVDGNSKITRENGTYAAPVPNAFSLPAAAVPDPYPHTGPRACPGSTAACRSSCYVKGLAQHAPEIYRHYTSNAEALAVVLAYGPSAIKAAAVLAAWIRNNAPHGFRWHVSGDVLNETHAKWIADVCYLASDVPFWIYTRTFNAVPWLARAPNLAVNVSADADNYTAARAVALTLGARICYLAQPREHAWAEFHENAPPVCKLCGAYEGAPQACTGIPDDLPPGSVIFPDYELRGRALAVPTDAPWWQTLSAEHRKMVCPTDFFGQSEAHRCGPCTKCF